MPVMLSNHMVKSNKKIHKRNSIKEKNNSNVDIDVVYQELEEILHRNSPDLKNHNDDPDNPEKIKYCRLN